MSLDLTRGEEMFSADKMMKDYLVPGSPMDIFSREIYPLFKDSDFKEMYSEKGRNGISPAFLAMVTLLQFRENLSDEEAHAACSMRIDWKIALRKPLEERVEFDPSTLCHFRKRLKENEAMSLILDKTIHLAKEKGFIKKRTNQRIDATHVIAHVNRISTTDLLFRTVKCVVEEMGKRNPAFWASEVPEDIKERYENDFSSFGLSKEKRADRQAEIVEDGLFLKKLWERLPAEARADYVQVAVMDTIFEENIVIRKKEIGEKEFIEVEEIETPKQSIFNPRDPEIKLGIKGRKSWIGSKCHVVETAGPHGPNIITDMIYQKATENDNKVLDRQEENNSRLGIDAVKLYCDSNYLSGEKMAAFEAQGKKLMGYFQADGSSKPKGFKACDFKIDVRGKMATCPAQHVTTDFSVRGGRIWIRFDERQCGGCEYFSLCVGEKKKSRDIGVIEHYEYIQRRRDEQKSDAFRQEMRIRARVEGTISEAVRFHGLRRKKYKGSLGDKLQFYMTGAAINIKRMLKAMSELQRPLLE